MVTIQSHFTSIVLHPYNQGLTKYEQRLFLITSIALGVLSLGTIHLCCFLYNLWQKHHTFCISPKETIRLILPSPASEEQSRVMPPNTASETPPPQNNRFSDEILQSFTDKFNSPREVQARYIDPAVVQSENSRFTNARDLLNVWDMSILVSEYVDRHANDSAYKNVEIKVIQEHTRHFHHLTTLLNTLIPSLDDKKGLIIIAALDRHIMPFYIKKIGTTIKCFIFDPAYGIRTDQEFIRSYFDAKFIEMVEKHHFDAEIIKCPHFIQADERNCSIYTLSAMRFYAKHGDQLFSSIHEEDLVPRNAMIVDQDVPQVRHLRLDRIPPPLLKLTQRTSLHSINNAYISFIGRPLSPSYCSQEAAPFFKTHENTPVSKSGITLTDYLTRHRRSVMRGTSEIQWNFAAHDKMTAYRKRIAKILHERGVIDENRYLANVEALSKAIKHLSDTILVLTERT